VRRALARLDFKARSAILASDILDDNNDNANQEHKNRDPVDPVHDLYIGVFAIDLFSLFK
jgi:hypothetical protein